MTCRICGKPMPDAQPAVHEACKFATLPDPAGKKKSEIPEETRQVQR